MRHNCFIVIQSVNTTLEANKPPYSVIFISGNEIYSYLATKKIILSALKIFHRIYNRKDKKYCVYLLANKSNAIDNIKFLLNGLCDGAIWSVDVHFCLLHNMLIALSVHIVSTHRTYPIRHYFLRSIERSSHLWMHAQCPFGARQRMSHCNKCSKRDIKIKRISVYTEIKIISIAIILLSRHHSISIWRSRR